MLVVYRPGHHCDLHSSPTRRSSDLFFTERFLPGFLATDNTRRMVYALVWRNANREKEGRDHFYAPYPGHPAEDRKSTRLNSSHVAISYAVFCLKKKNSDKSQVKSNR